MALIISSDVVSLLRQSGGLLGDAGSRVAAEHVYEEFAQLPGGREFTYDLQVRIQSTANLIECLIRAFSATPCSVGGIEAVFRGVGLAHFRAGLPLSLLEHGPPIFARSLARAAHAEGHHWSSDHSRAWTELFTQGVVIQKEVYSRAASAPQVGGKEEAKVPAPSTVIPDM